MAYMHSAGVHLPTRSPDRIAADVIAAMRRGSELQMLAVLCVFYWLIYTVEAVGLYRFANWIGPSALAMILATSCYRIVEANPIAIWAPLFWFRLACAVYFGFGSLVPYVANQHTLDSIKTVYYFDDETLLKVNVVVSTSILATLAFSYVFLRQRVSKRPQRLDLGGEANTRRNLLMFALGFLLIGGTIRYGLMLPNVLGITDTIVPGVIRALGRTYYVGIYLVITYSLHYNRPLVYFIFLLILFEISVAVALFSKTELLLILIFVFLGFISRGASYFKMVIGASLVLGAFFIFQPLVGFGRVEVNQSYGGQASLEQRWMIVRLYLDGGAAEAKSERQGGIARLSYVNTNAFVIRQYDGGMPGHTLGDAAAVFIPRVLWPDKPVITRLGPELYYLVSGHGGSALGVGHFAEAYWNFGWAGILPFMAVLALILSIFTKVSMSIMARKDWLMLPVVFMGVNIGLRVDGHFVPDIIGAAWIALVTGLALALGKSMLLTLAFPGKTVVR